MISVITGKKNIASLYKDNESNPDNEELNLSKSNIKDMNESEENINAVSESEEIVNDIEKSEEQIKQGKMKDALTALQNIRDKYGL